MSKINDKQKQQVIELRKQGLGYRRIANEIDGLNQDNVGDFIRTKWFAENHPELVKIDVVKALKAPKKFGEAKCKQCGANFVKKAGHQIYCSVDCKYSYAKKDKPKPKVKTKSCKNCNFEFKTTDNRKIHCSTRCSVEYNSNKKKKNKGVCDICGDSLPKHKKKFCSDECFKTNRKEYYKKRRVERTCQECSGLFLTNETGQKFCSNECVVESNRIHPLATCERCGTTFASKPGRANKFCNRDCYLEQIGGKSWKTRREGHNNARNLTHIRRAKRYGVRYESIDIEKVYEDDGWTCQICHEHVDKFTPYPNPKSASLDHIIPLSKGGTHTIDNVQLSHMECNRDKYDNLPTGAKNKQLTLI